jgi:hypothetical protein
MAPGNSIYHLGARGVLISLKQGELRPYLNISSNHILYPDIGHLKPSDAYYESGWKRLVDRYETRLDSNALRINDLVHISVRDVDKANARSGNPAYRHLLNMLELEFMGLQIAALTQLERELSRTRLRTTVRYHFCQNLKNIELRLVFRLVSSR